MIDRDTESEVETELSLDDILGAGLEEAHDAFTEAETGAGGAATPVASTGDRDEQGRFKARGDGSGDGTAKAGETGDKITDQGTKAGDGAAVQGPPSDAPASWSAAAKAHWKTLPPDVQAEAHRREADFAKGIEQKSQAGKPNEALEQIIGPRRNALAATYGSPENAVAQLFKLSDFADAEPGKFADWFLRQRGIDPVKLFAGAAAGAQPGNGQQPGEAAQGALPPDIAAAIDRVERSQEQFIEQYVNGPIKARAQSELTKFEADPKNVHYGAVKQDMARILAGAADDMTYEQAYDTACWANPTIRQQLLETERQTAIAKKTEEAAKVAATAKKVTGARFSPATPSKMKPTTGNIDQTMNEVYDRMNGA